MAEFLPLRQKAPMMLGIMWTFQTIAFVLVGLRLYTRLVVVHQYGMEDHFFNLSVFFLLAYVIIMTVAARYGLGQEMTNPASAETSRALLLCAIGQTVTTFAVITIKISIAFFLLRLVGHNTVHRLAIIVPVTLMSLAVFITAWLIWFSCTPLSYPWNITAPGGDCDHPTQFWSVLVSGVLVVGVELWYASFPWYMIRGLMMPRREKILVGTSMSISYISAGCSIFRLLNLVQLADQDDNNFLVKMVDIFIWHAADVTTQLLCIGVTVCRPLYKDWLYRVADRIEIVSDNAGNNRQDSTYGARKAPDNIALRTVGGGVREPTSDGANSDKQSGGVAHSSRKYGSNIRGALVFQSDD